MDGVPHLSDWLSPQSLSSLSLCSQSQDGRPRLYIRAIPCAGHLCARLASLVSLVSLSLHATLSRCVRLAAAAARVSLLLLLRLNVSRLVSLLHLLAAARLSPRVSSRLDSRLFSLLSSAAAHSTSRCCSPLLLVSASSLPCLLVSPLVSSRALDPQHK